MSNALRPHERLDDKAMAYALQLVRDRPGVVIDVGANNGKQSMMAVLARRRRFAIECLSSAYTDLLHIFRNVSADNITIVHACAGRKLELSVLNLWQTTRPASSSTMLGWGARQKSTCW